MKSMKQPLRLACALLLSVVCFHLQAETTTFAYTATSKIDRFDEVDHFTGATDVVSHEFADGKGTVVYDGAVTALASLCLMHNSALMSIDIPEGVTTIGFHAFYNCSHLTTIKLPKSLNKIEGLAFDACSSLKDGKLIVDDLAWWCGISFGDHYSNPLYYAHHLYSDEETEITELVIPDEVVVIPANAFVHCEAISGLRLPSGLTEIGNNAFGSCFGLESVTIPGSVATIGSGAFEYCTALKEVTISEGVTTIGMAAFARSGITSLTLPSTIRSMSQSFYQCPDLAELTLTEGITTLDNSFYGCTALKEVHIPSSVKKLNYNDFSGCTALEAVTIAEGVEEVDGFSGCEKLAAVNIPSTATKVRGFKNCKSLTTIWCPKGATQFSGFNNCTGLTKVIIEDVASWCNILFDSYGTYNAQYYAQHLYIGNEDDNEEITELVIPCGITELKRYAFDNLSSITSVSLPPTITKLDGTAFRNCTGIADVYCYDTEPFISWNGAGFMPEKMTKMHVNDADAWSAKFPDANVTFVSETAPRSIFYYSAGKKMSEFDNLEDFAGASSQLSHIFGGNYGMAVFSGVVTGIEANTFAGNEDLISIMLPESMTTLGDEVFIGCANLASVNIPASVTAIGGKAFGDCSGLTRIDAYPNPVKVALGADVFLNVPKDGTLHVLPRLLSAYQTADQWKDFFNLESDLEEELIKGDVNGDKQVTSTDIACVVNVLAGLESAAQYGGRADVTGDGGAVTAADIAAIVNILAGLE